MHDYVNILEFDSWGDSAKGIYYSPLSVIKNPKRYSDDYNRIIYADLSYPIIISSDGYVIDGVHRLAKAFLQKKKYLKAYVFDQNLMKKFKIATMTKNVWEKIDKMPYYKLISLYFERFC